MEAVIILAVVAVIAVAAAVSEPYRARRSIRKAEDRRLEAVFSVMRLFGEKPRRWDGEWRHW